MRQLRSHRSFGASLDTQLLVMVMAMAAIMSLLVHEMWSGYYDTIQDSKIRTRDYAALIERAFDTALRSADSNLQLLQRQLPLRELKARDYKRYEAKWNTELDARLRRFPELSGFRVFDVNGGLLYTSVRSTDQRSNIADRPHFIEAAKITDDSAVISQVLVTRTTNKRMVVVARPLRDELGQFRGIVTASIDFNYFLSLFESLELGPRGTIGIYRSDTYTQVLRWPRSDQTISTPLPPDAPSRKVIGSGAKTATVEVTSSVDGITRIYSINRLNNFPLFVLVGEARDDVLGDWRTQSILIGLTSVVLVALILWLIVRLSMTRERLAERNADFETLLDQTTDFIYYKDKDSRIRFCSQSMADITGYRNWREMQGKHDREIFTPEMAKIYIDEEIPIFAKGMPLLNKVDPYVDARGDRGYVMTNKWPVLDAEDRVVGIFGISRDITEQRRLQAELEEKAHFDFLTGVSNRGYFMEQATAEIVRSLRYRKQLSALIMDIDYFKRVNDTHGHEAGDIVLKHVAGVGREAVREIDVIGRIGGEEFAVLLPETGMDKAIEVAERLRMAYAGTSVLLPDGDTIRFTVSIGVSTLTTPMTNIDALLREADAALYQAKQTGRNKVCVASPPGTGS